MPESNQASSKLGRDVTVGPAGCHFRNAQSGWNCWAVIAVHRTSLGGRNGRKIPAESPARNQTSNSSAGRRVVEERPTVSVTEQWAVSVGQVVEGSTGTELVPEVRKKSIKATRILREKTETAVQDVQLAFKEVPGPGQIFPVISIGWA